MTVPIILHVWETFLSQKLRFFRETVLWKVYLRQAYDVHLGKTAKWSFFLMCLLTSYSGDQIKEVEADGAFGTFVEEQNYIQFL